MADHFTTGMLDPGLWVSRLEKGRGRGGKRTGSVVGKVGLHEDCDSGYGYTCYTVFLR